MKSMATLLAPAPAPAVIRPSRPAPLASPGAFVGPYDYDNRIWTPEAMDEYADLMGAFAVAGPRA